MVLQFRYRQVSGKKRPCVPIRLTGPTMAMDIDTILDTGADITIIPKTVAEAIGLDLTAAHQSMGGIGGSIDAIPTSVSIRISKGREYRVIDNAPVLVPNDNNLSFSLLGRQKIFEKFKVIIDEENQMVTLKPKPHRGRRGRGR